MDSQPHLQIFNTSPTAKQDREFTLFTLLPKELRLQIWRHAMQRQRLIRIYVLSLTSGPLDRERTNTQEANISDSADKRMARHYAIVDGYQVLSKFLRVSREARQESLSFYRVHIPCHFNNQELSPGTLYFNPEYDFLRIESGSPINDTLFDFIYHLKHTYDPQHVGLLNLAMNCKGIEQGYKHVGAEGSDLDPDVRKAFQQTLTQLHEVFLVASSTVGRIMAGKIVSGLWFPFRPFEFVIFNRSYPIAATAPTFDRFERDPRPISQDLERVFEEIDQKYTLNAWGDLLQTWKVSPTQIQYRVLVTFDPSNHMEITNCASAERYLPTEEEEWRRLSHEISQTEDLVKAVKPAFGFWLFPVEAFGPFHGEEDYSYRRRVILDMTGHWPELGLSNLPVDELHERSSTNRISPMDFLTPDLHVEYTDIQNVPFP